MIFGLIYWNIQQSIVNKMTVFSGVWWQSWVVINQERNGINWGACYSSFIEQALYFYNFDDITNLFRLLYKKH